MKKISAFIMVSLIGLLVPVGTFAQNGEHPTAGTITTRQGTTAPMPAASSNTNEAPATSQNRGDPLLALLYFGEITGEADIVTPAFGMRIRNRYAGLVMLAQAEDPSRIENHNVEEDEKSPDEEEDEKSPDDDEDEKFPDDDEDEEFADEDAFPEEEMPPTIADPFEPINRVFFHFNDKLYFWLLKPIATGYGFITPEPVRVSFNNFFDNLLFPIRFFGCLMQGKQFEAGEEMRRFSINTFMGLGGFFDVASRAGIKKYDEDLGQTLAVWGLGPGFYMNWPVLGPSSLRDTIGFIGDRFLYPVSYILDPTTVTFALNAFDIINKTSLRLGDYEDLKEAAFDPYVALRDAYYQNRLSKIKE